MVLTSEQITTLLAEHQLLVTSPEFSGTFTSIAYDSRKAQADTLFFCKGNFKVDYLDAAIIAGATAYISEKIYPEVAIPGVHVRDVQKAMAVLSAAFFDFPQNQLKIIAYTGTKGKTTSAYFTRGILNAAHPDHVALFSTIDRIVGPKPTDRFKSDLSTPESLDLFRDMRTAVDNGMTQLVMEVSSQAYKKNRVYGLTFDVGIFLNITPDHIGRNEHPTFEDYLHCKLQLMVHSRVCLINRETAHFEAVYQAALATTEPTSVFTFGNQLTDADIRFENLALTETGSDIQVITHSQVADELQIAGNYHIRISGDFNESNATAAITAAALVGVTDEVAKKGLSEVTVPGRMESVAIQNHGLVYVDYAHNYGSMKALLTFLTKEYQVGRLIVVVGSPGDKGISRRADFGRVLTEFADYAYLTTDDPGFEDPNQICAAIEAAIDPTKVTVTVELDRKKAIEEAISFSKPNDIVVLAGKGNDPYQKVKGVDTPYETDMVIAKNFSD